MQRIMLGYEKPPTLEEIKRVAKNITNVGAKITFVILAETGLRPVEVFNLTMKQVDLSERIIRPLHLSKTKRAYISFISKPMYKFITKQYLPWREWFLEHYQNVVSNIGRDAEKWMYPNGTVAKDPYSVGASRSFTGKYVVRVIGKELDRRDFVTAMQPQNPYWQKFLAKWCIKTIDLGADMIFLDSPDMLFTFNWDGDWGDNETWEGQGLIRHLRSVFSNEELTAMGINSLENFSLAKYLSMKYGKPKIYTTPMILRGAFTASWPPESVAFNNVTEVLQDPILENP